MRRDFSPADRTAIFERDGGCLGPRVGMLGACFGALQVDHILNGGLGLKGPNVPENGATLCLVHHRTKTDSARRWRPLLVNQVRQLMGDEPLSLRELTGCVDKRRFATRHEAVLHARNVQRDIGRKVAYRCPSCGGYHVGRPQ